MTDYTRDAMNALSDLNIFAAVVTILEGGHLYCTKSNKAADRIIQLCKFEQHKRLQEMDYAKARADDNCATDGE